MRYLAPPARVTFLSLAISAQVYAQTDVTSVQQTRSQTQDTDIMTVTAARSVKNIADIAGTVYSIEREDIAKQSSASRSTADILGQLVPGLAPSSGTTSNYGMTMRGRTVQVMIDGVPLTGSRDGSRQLNSISPTMIERVEVVSGATSLYGAGATGGIINIITRNADDEPYAFSSQFGLKSADKPSKSGMAYSGTQTASFHNDDISGFAGLNYTAQGDMRNAHGNRIGPEIAQTDRQDTTSLDFNSRLTWHLNDNQQLSGAFRYYNDEQDSDYGPDYGPGLAALFTPATFQPSLKGIKGLQLDDQPRTRHYGVNTQYQNRDILGGQQLTAEAYYRKEQSRWFPSVSAVTHSALPGGSTYVAMQSNTDIDVWGVRTALQKNMSLAGRDLQLTYGLDYEQEKDSQSGQSYGLNTFIASNGLRYQAENRYAMGPDVKVDKTGLFLQSDYALTKRLNLQSGLRHETIRNKVSTSTPYSEAITADRVSGYQARQLEGGQVKHGETLYNLGLVYQLTDTHQLFTNFSQGFSLPDTQRMLRDVPATFTINGDSIDSIKVNNYELGWRMRDNRGLSAGVTAFYNTSDKVVQFNRDYSVSVADTDERIWGMEGNLQYPLSESWNVGGTLAYTRGEYKDAAGEWRELNAFRVSPLKATLYSDWTFADGYGLRLQSLTVGGTDRAYNDAKSAAVSSSIRSTPAAKIQGYTVFDLIAHAPLLGGQVGFGIYNLANRDYKTVYSQQAEATYGKISSLPAQGRTFALTYSIDY
ncbi:TonB-dependent receptor [Pectobacterium aroidearum]|uniref:TonB-dependent receptor n=1 Tax=Pectobacterium aroidearum TaxID=1201031 RepID=A0ABR5ZJC4_9GAMM|nr:MULTISPECIES: TonB-dependent receptor [Pectobacterium]MBA5201887.1 TonB-dependent receptor [Pectobacterium aroidearum]MBA5230256.1 TonB-dependent receptor [Pectobacterium aroidearum]MBA5234679.1 TonB-dependent receptor [Pectobacterium aroidearum]MBA5739877.1 TonB-dependent receptor [Pectobacterium aroidearum]UXJ99272.1 TonB-dependent receptor [Pectobacterium aroidearum]